MSVVMKKGVMVVAVLFCCVGLAFAGHGYGDRNGGQDQGDRLRDGSCLENIGTDNFSGLVLAGNGNGGRGKGQGGGKGKGQGQGDRLRDGSCLDNVEPVKVSALTLAGNGNGARGKGGGDRQRRQDGSCLL